jgi:hypothetical protein
MSIPPSSSTSQQFTYAASATSATAANGTYFPTPFHLQQSDPYPKPYVTSPPTVMAPVYPPAPIGPVYSLPQYQQVSNCICICCIWEFFFYWCWLRFFDIEWFGHGCEIVLCKVCCSVFWSGFFWVSGKLGNFRV